MLSKETVFIFRTKNLMGGHFEGKKIIGPDSLKVNINTTQNIMITYKCSHQEFRHLMAV